jgi:type II secretory pathway pseudopilin PulG
MRALLTRLRREDGVGAVEMLVSIALVGTVAGALMTMVSTTSHWSTNVKEQSAQQGEVRSALDSLSADLRQATTLGGGSAVESVGATQFTFDSPDRATPFHLRRISYRLVDGELQRSVATSTNTGAPPWNFAAAGPWLTQATGIVNTQPFSFLDAAAAATTTPSAVRSITVTLQMRPERDAARVTTYTTNVTLRTPQ